LLLPQEVISKPLLGQGLNIDEPLAMLRSSTTSYYQADGLASITSLSNGVGALAQTYTFDSFGKQTAASGSLTNPFQYTSRESDLETGLYYYRAKDYDPVVDRFLSKDPITFKDSMRDPKWSAVARNVNSATILAAAHAGFVAAGSE
jgi:RHS repeat-associated protein